MSGKKKGPRRCEPQWGSCTLESGHKGRHSQSGPYALADLRAECARLREALERHGRHTVNCQYGDCWCAALGSAPAKCECGSPSPALHDVACPLYAPAKEPTTNPVDAGSSVSSSPAKADEPKPCTCSPHRPVQLGHGENCPRLKP